ncbi:hypothetical protein SAMN05660964_00630 [Thiothrix caldifontis]|uniref:Kazal-like domain-containing protein n=1 Tax=Thiothrix caldifontis TaxID=525918 RepID=A0A1H3XCB4_9GAMM|nr:hypothetical protein [Thiothrix caldifontis]SDZ96188.1 hypothetical protein SAMN05660964_00630 [Thiothrix caldifontis]
MKSLGILLLGGVLLITALSGCSRSDAAEGMADTASFQPCREPRPEICYESFVPVCATLSRVNGQFSQPVTYANDCKACADPQVQGFVPGACP